MDKTVRNNEVAVLISSDFGAGWSTWADEHYAESVLFDPWIVDVLLSDQYSQQEKIQRIQSHCGIKYPGMYLGALKYLVVVWVPQGTEFMISEHDGRESIEFKNQVNWITA